MVDQLKRFTSITRVMPVVVLIVTLMAGLWGIAPRSAYAAEPAISIETELGYGGSYKNSVWIPVTITLKSDSDISGEIVVRTESSNSQGIVTQIKVMDLPAGTPKKVTLSVIGNVFTKDNTSIRFYKGNAETGKYIPFTLGKSYLQSSPKQGTLVGVLANDPDTMNFLSALNGNGRDVTVIPLKGEQIPDDGLYLESLDVLVINDYSMDALEESQFTGISDWVNRGGTLALAGGSGYPKSAKGLESLSPVEYTGTSQVTSLPELEKAGGKSLSLEHPLTVSEAQLKDGATGLFNYDTGSIFASWNVGKGDVLYAAYDISQDPLNSWSGHATVWSTVLGGKLLSDAALQGGGNKYYFENFKSSMDYLLDYFPSLTFPPFSRLFWMLIAYVLIVAPVLYYVLKRFDKREWAWLGIPVIAIVASVSIYFAGTSGKTTARTHTLNVMELDGSGHAYRTTASSLFVPRGGDYELEFAEGTHVMIKREDGLLTGNNVSNSTREFVREQEEATTVKLLDMTHRSIAKAWIDQVETRAFGQFNIDITYDSNGQPQGTVANNTDRNLTNAALIIGGNIHLLGDLSPKQSVQISMHSAIVSYGDYGRNVFQYNGNYQNDPYERERNLMDNYLGNLSAPYNNVVIAWDQEALSEYKVNGKNVPTEQLNMWVQQVQLHFVNKDNQEINIPYGFIEGNISSTTSSDWGRERAGRVYMAEGEMDLEYNITGVDYGAIFSQLDISQKDQGNRITAMIWNYTLNDWEPLPWVQGEVTITEDVDHYIQGSKLMIRISSIEWNSFEIPEISLKGRVNE